MSYGVSADEFEQAMREIHRQIDKLNIQAPLVPVSSVSPERVERLERQVAALATVVKMQQAALDKVAGMVENAVESML